MGRSTRWRRRTDFTEEEWETLQKGVTGAGFWMTIADRGFFDTFKEAGAMAKHLAGRPAERRERRSSAISARRRARASAGRSSPEEVESETTAALGKAQQILEAKAPDELDAYRAFVLEVAESVGQAAKGGEAAEAGDAREDQSRARRLALESRQDRVVGSGVLKGLVLLLSAVVVPRRRRVRRREQRGHIDRAARA